MKRGREEKKDLEVREDREEEKKVLEIGEENSLLGLVVVLRREEDVVI